ncbi:MAG: low molecular weight protein-tyrosine-phosphatase [Ruminococcus sp.]|nr:low molecular weight protein-tyrosine-phosphatase [Ruminococcus sp.]
MINVLMICHGNICRSPMAEFVLKDIVKKRHLDSQFHIESAATSYEEIGNPVYPPARRELAKHGISCEGKQARKLVKRDFQEFDYLIAMEEYNLRNIRREFGQELAGQVKLLLDYTDEPGDIDDPWYTGNFTKTYEEIVKGCQGFLDYLMK